MKRFQLIWWCGIIVWGMVVATATFFTDKVRSEETGMVWEENVAPDAKPRVLFFDGGHGYNEASMEKLLDSLRDQFVIDRAHLPDDNGLFTPELAKKYDAMILYDQNHSPLSDEAKQALWDLYDAGIGTIALHHHIGAHSAWPEFWRTMGGYYVREGNKTATGREVPVSTYTDDVPMKIHIEKPLHSITQGMSDFDVVDEAYANVYVDENVEILLTTDEPKASHAVAWLWETGNSPVLTFLLGHGPSTFENPNFRQILRRGLVYLINDVQKRREQNSVPEIDESGSNGT